MLWVLAAEYGGRASARRPVRKSKSRVPPLGMTVPASTMPARGSRLYNTSARCRWRSDCSRPVGQSGTRLVRG
jgi:hypothetical protein